MSAIKVSKYDSELTPKTLEIYTKTAQFKFILFLKNNDYTKIICVVSYQPCLKNCGYRKTLLNT